MKILKIEFENINSLAGEWSIDFTDPSYSELDHSLFVISGNTGVGKTSILDAITLALYGATPRQGIVYKKTGDEAKSSDKGNAVMTSGKCSCYARVTYKCRKGTFVSEWSQSRAKSKSDGNLKAAHGKIWSINNPKNPIFDNDTGKSGEFGRKNADNIQLDYSQFCRSIMLAQGEFSKFLTSDERERADILEKLNGTERFRRIGARVGDHRRAASAARDNALAAYNTQTGNMPSAEEIDNDEALLAESAAKEKNLVAQKTELESKINWRNSMNTCTGNLQKAESELARANQAKTDFSESEVRLSDAEKARECASLHTELLGLRKRESSDKAELERQKELLPEVMEKLTRAGEAKSLAEKAKTDAENFIAENDALWNEIRKLDQDVKNAVNAKSEAETRKKKAAGALAKAADDLEKAKNDIKSIEPQVETLKQTQESNAKDSKLTGIIPQSETFVSNIRKLDADIKKAEQAKTAAAKDIAKVEDNFKVAFQRKQELLDEQNELFRNEVLVLANVIQKHLVEGEACPVCGSKEHPACSHAENIAGDESGVSNTAEKIRELNAKMQDVDAKINACEIEKNRAANAEQAAAENIDSLTSQKGEIAGTIATLWKPWAEFDIEKADDVLADLKNRLQQFETNKTLLDNLSKRLELARNNESVYGDAVEKERNSLAAETEAYDTAVRNLDALQKTRADKFGDNDVETVAKEANDRKNAAETAYAAADKTFRDAENRSNELNTTIKSLKDALEKVAVDIEKSTANFKTAIEAKGFADENAFLKAAMPEQEFTQLQAKKKSIDEALASAKGKLQVATEALEKVKTERSDETPLQTLVEQKQTAEKELGELQQRTGAARNRVENYKKNAARLQELQKKLDAATAECTRWETMGNWFGVMNGDDFATFVQGLTFKSLLKLANKHLKTIKDRFRLVANGNLGFKVNDAEFDEDRRTTNLSGGEKFLVSLSLALGIADFASRNVRVESLFMDEGFGTLDDETLEDVMECLKSQQRQGKMLGIITHVDSVVNSIHQRIHVEHCPGQNGHSFITGPGVTRLPS